MCEYAWKCAFIHSKQTPRLPYTYYLPRNVLFIHRKISKNISWTFLRVLLSKRIPEDNYLKRKGQTFSFSRHVKLWTCVGWGNLFLTCFWQRWMKCRTLNLECTSSYLQYITSYLQYIILFVSAGCCQVNGMVWNTRLGIKRSTDWDFRGKIANLQKIVISSGKRISQVPRRGPGSIPGCVDITFSERYRS